MLVGGVFTGVSHACGWSVHLSIHESLPCDQVLHSIHTPSTLALQVSLFLLLLLSLSCLFLAEGTVLETIGFVVIQEIVEVSIVQDLSVYSSLYHTC